MNRAQKRKVKALKIFMLINGIVSVIAYVDSNEHMFYLSSALMGIGLACLTELRKSF